MGESIAEVAAGLNSIQLGGIRRAEPLEPGNWLLPLGTGRGLIALGIATRTIDGMCLTPFGFAVRNHLISQGADHDR